jgi:hypothetical protein
MAMYLAVLKLMLPVKGVLTEGATVTANGIYNSGSDIGYSNCLWGLVDGKFSPMGYSSTTKCCAHTTCVTNAWLNINLGAKTVVWTVIINNRDENSTVANRIIGSDLHVGDSSLPYENMACGALPTASGAYSCGGKIGRYLGLRK